MRAAVVDAGSRKRLEMHETKTGVVFMITMFNTTMDEVEVTPQQVKFVRDELNKYLAAFLES